ncbi:unnamed protein product [Ixodes persulcatus]
MLSWALLGMVRSHFKLRYTLRLQISKPKGRVLTEPPHRELVEHRERNASSRCNSHSLVSLNTALQNQTPVSRQLKVEHDCSPSESKTKTS